MIKTGLIQIIICILSGVAARGSWWDVIPEELRLMFSLALFFVNFLVLAGVLYLAGLIVVGKKRTLLSSAFIISLLGTVLSTAFFLFIPYRLLALFLSVFVLLLLIKRLYGTGWLGAVGVGIIAVVVFLVVTVILALIFNILEVIMERFFSFILQTI
jgi:hypothetical protein